MINSCLLSIPQFGAEFGPCRSVTYELLKTGEIAAVKVGRRTYITRESAEAWLDKLPRYSPQHAAE
jgi:hypothetical protein